MALIIVKYDPVYSAPEEIRKEAYRQASAVRGLKQFYH